MTSDEWWMLSGMLRRIVPHGDAERHCLERAVAYAELCAGHRPEPRPDLLPEFNHLEA